MSLSFGRSLQVPVTPSPVVCMWVGRFLVRQVATANFYGQTTRRASGDSFGGFDCRGETGPGHAQDL